MAAQAEGAGLKEKGGVWRDRGVVIGGEGVAWWDLWLVGLCEKGAWLEAEGRGFVVPPSVPCEWGGQLGGLGSLRAGGRSVGVEK